MMMMTIKGCSDEDVTDDASDLSSSLFNRLSLPACSLILSFHHLYHSRHSFFSLFLLSRWNERNDRNDDTEEKNEDSEEQSTTLYLMCVVFIKMSKYAKFKGHRLPLVFARLFNHRAIFSPDCGSEGFFVAWRGENIQQLHTETANRKKQTFLQ